MELKVACACGQKYAFDVEPLNGRMPAAVACPVCGVDGTETANQLLAQVTPSVPPPISVAPPPRLQTALAPAAFASVPAMAPAPPAYRPGVAAVSATGEFSMARGIAGALLGAVVSSGLMYAFFLWAQFRFPLMGTCVGAAVGYGARLLAKGTESSLGAFSALVAVLATAGTLYMMFGAVSGFYFVTIGISGWFAYRISS